MTKGGKRSTVVRYITSRCYYGVQYDLEPEQITTCVCEVAVDN